MIFICLSNQHYDLPLKTNKHLVMDELNSRGFPVVFVDPPTRVDALKKLIKNRSLVHKKSKNFYVYSPLNILNFFPFSWISNVVHAYIIKRIVHRITTKNDTSVLWAYHFDFPRIFQLKKLLNPTLFIYDVVDDYASFPEYDKRDIKYKKRNFILYWLELLDRFFKEFLDQKGKKGREWVVQRELELSKESDLMFASHPILFEKFNRLNGKTFYTPNAGAYELYSKQPSEEPHELKVLKRPIVGYSGAIDAYKFDVDLFLYTATNTPDINYVLIGPLQVSDSSENVEKLKKLKNVHLVGVKPNEETAQFTHYFDSYIIPYQTNEYVYNGCFPIKFFNSLATGVPVVVTDLPAYRGFEDVLYIAKDKKEFLELVKKSVKDKHLDSKKKRIKVASQNTWKHKVDKQMQAIGSVLESLT